MASKSEYLQLLRKEITFAMITCKQEFVRKKCLLKVFKGFYEMCHWLKVWLRCVSVSWFVSCADPPRSSLTPDPAASSTARITSLPSSSLSLQDE